MYAANIVDAIELSSPPIEPVRLKQLLSDDRPPLVVDVRSPDEYSSGHIANSINIPVPLIAKRLDELRAAPELVLYCNDTRFTRMAETILINSKVYGFMHLSGGLNAWQDANLPLEISFE